MFPGYSLRAVSGPVMAEKDQYDKLDSELREMLDRYLAP